MAVQRRQRAMHRVRSNSCGKVAAALLSGCFEALNMVLCIHALHLASQLSLYYIEPYKQLNASLTELLYKYMYKRHATDLNALDHHAALTFCL